LEPRRFKLPCDWREFRPNRNSPWSYRPISLARTHVDVIRAAAREYLLGSLARYAPEAVEDLQNRYRHDVRNRLLEAFAFAWPDGRPTLETAFAEADGTHTMLTRFFAALPESSKADVSALAEAWAENWRLQAPWVVEGVVRSLTLAALAEFVGAKIPFALGPFPPTVTLVAGKVLIDAIDGRSGVDLPAPITPPAWDPLTETSEDYFARLREMLEPQAAAVGKTLAESGFVEERPRGWDRLFRRFIAYQVKGRSPERIARDEANRDLRGVEPSAVWRDVTEAARLLGLRRRPRNPPGRYPKR